MSNITIKCENEDDLESNGSLNALTTLLHEVKKEEHISLSGDEEAQVENDEANAVAEPLPESFFDDLFTEEIEACSDEATTEADIQKLQEIIAKRKRILNEYLELPKEDEHRRAQSPSLETERRKRKEIEDGNNEHNDNQSKRPRQRVNANQYQYKSVSLDRPENDCEPSAVNMIPDPEMELEKLLKSDDYNEELPGMSTNNMQPLYTFPNAMTMMPAIYNSTTKQMIPSMPLGDFPMMCNIGFPPGLYPPNMMSMQMMGLSQVNTSQQSSDDIEVQCLTVVGRDSGLPKIPFKRIKLEKAETTVGPAEDPKRKVINACIKLLEAMNVSQSTGKFVYTCTVTKQNNFPPPNSILQKTTNVSYNFQSIGPKPNIQDWGLKSIPTGNTEIAKKISISADKYFAKISENANTIARKLIKKEVTETDKNRQQEQEEMEVEEPTLSTYFKNSMTQTEPLVCRDCVVRKRKVGHNIAVQASVFTGSIGSQTDLEVRYNEELTKGLSDNQLKAMYEFSLLIRETPKNTSMDLVRLREKLMNMYNLSQRPRQVSEPFRDSSSPHFGMADSRPSFDPRKFIPNITQNSPQQFISNYSEQGTSIPNYHQIPPAQYSGHVRNDSGYVQSIPQEQARQIPNNMLNMGHGGYSASNASHQRPEPQSNEFAIHDGRKKYGRGAMRR